MQDALTGLAKLIRRHTPVDGLHATPVPGMHYIRRSETDRHRKCRWGASLCIVVLGRKELVLDKEVYRIGPAEYVLTPMDLPVVSRIARASAEKPFLSVKMDLDPRTLSEVANRFGSVLPKELPSAPRAVFVGKAGDAMLEAALRLGTLLDKPDDAPALGPLVLQEVLYHLLKGPDGPAIRQFARIGTKMHRVLQAVHALRSDLSEALDVTALARTATMSRSAFFKYFKEATAMSPIQYQKRLRLLEARRLMIDDGETAEGSAFKVGYKSASQFSKEYSRMFGEAPLRDTARIKSAGEPIFQE